jgi:dsDNA-binding SOS-regulon protein
MAKSLSDIVKNTKGIEEVAAQIKSVAMFYAPKKTKNLLRALNTYNKPKTMWKSRVSGDRFKLTFILNTSPPGAEYGQWWNKPTVSRTVRNGDTKNVPNSIDFGNKAFTDKSVRDEYDKLLINFKDELVDDFTKRMNTAIKNFYIR